MATVSVKDVQSLNKRIEKINTEKTRVETRSQMLKDQILADIKAYKDKFGVDLHADNFAEIKKLISAEAKKVASEVSEEYELKEKVVSCIEKGDIDEANRLLGIVEESPEETVEEEVDEDAEDEETYESLNTEDIEEESEVEEDDFELDSVEGVMESISSEPGEDLIMEDEAVEGSETKSKSMLNEFDMSVDDDDDEDDDNDPFGFGDMLSGGKF